MGNINNIPKKIHLIWFGAEMDWYTKYHVNKIKEMYLDYEIKIWGLEDFDNNISKFTKKALREKKWAYLSDYWRAKILYDEGGIYLDVDMLPLKKLDDLFLEDNDLYLGFEYSKLITTGFAMSIKNHSFFKKVLDFYNNYDYIEDKKITFFVNNILWTKILVDDYDLESNNETQLIKDKVKVYSSEYFALKDFNKGKYFIHNHRLSWAKYKIIKKYSWILLDFVQKNDYKIDDTLQVFQKQHFNKIKKYEKELEKEIKWKK